MHYVNNYLRTHMRIAASEIFKEEKSSSLRAVILKVVELMAKGISVVVDDENWYIAIRKSYSTLVRIKVPNCTLKVLQFNPHLCSGYEQCLWAREWYLTERTLNEEKDYNLTFLILRRLQISSYQTGNIDR
ncbi:uncharacterized protein LOC124447351 [Xenia sp. Carnegie-2017]|uniref:uncharacterized protein LOC124447351 n=1 Tax=Xenia sp. Carnegie-2017 TaxID=2897299 RepID=UPI001F04E42F|nr:uncharacterized protein LOC124447351 [Xenia sp. Carnegie-2017]